VAVVGWFSRFVLSWELSNTMETGFCLAALDAGFRFGQPEIKSLSLEQLRKNGDV
jgi:putative transposase